jgi:hypothetical protein
MKRIVMFFPTTAMSVLFASLVGMQVHGSVLLPREEIGLDGLAIAYKNETQWGTLVVYNFAPSAEGSIAALEPNSPQYECGDNAPFKCDNKYERRVLPSWYSVF